MWRREIEAIPSRLFTVQGSTLPLSVSKNHPNHRLKITPILSLTRVVWLSTTTHFCPFHIYTFSNRRSSNNTFCDNILPKDLTATTSSAQPTLSPNYTTINSLIPRQN
eukprot:TRINITY_DN2050_c0_g1_i2.p1 TRINITY_DN2050_c0_g1~~TRINITY_DN2050_c0_g1_i2.p1  ORF type:complete len:108 (-),score=5.08 TRINITY_DN2050_c0_g1_i2:284-607(-)